VPYPNTWNGSLWTLYFEFVCYLIVWVLGALAIFRRSVLLTAALWAGSVIVRILTATGTTGGLDGDFELLARLLPYFLGGSLVYLVVQRWGYVPLIGIFSLPIAAVLMVFVPLAGGPLAAPFLCYALLYLSTVVKQPAWIARNDISYGFYIYAWPMQQLVLIFGGAQFGIVIYILITAVATTLFAMASWFFIERPVMRMARRPAVRVPQL
jgi:peptidoglycan/LPS O-acetylase OafA/YrhL